MPNESRVVIVTGGAYGIGRATVSRFASAVGKVVIADVNSDRGRLLEQTVANTCFKQTDVRNEAEIDSLVQFAVERFGGIDVLCNNAGIESYRRPDEYTATEWSAVLDTNLRAGFLAAKYAYPHLRARKGCVVFTSSVQAIANEKNISIYAASKAGMLGLMRGMALDFAPDGVRVNAVCPGATLTGMMESALKDEPDQEAALQKIASRIPLQRLARPEDIANAIYFLASDQAAYITGSHIVVDGGLLTALAL